MNRPRTLVRRYARNGHIAAIVLLSLVLSAVTMYYIGVWAISRMSLPAREEVIVEAGGQYYQASLDRSVHMWALTYRGQLDRGTVQRGSDRVLRRTDLPRALRWVERTDPSPGDEQKCAGRPLMFLRLRRDGTLDWMYIELGVNIVLFACWYMTLLWLVWPPNRGTSWRRMGIKKR